MEEKAKVTKGKWTGWHFLPKDKCLRGGTKEKVQCGRIYKTDKDPEFCASGFHASYRAIDALQYAPGPIVCRVELRGKRIDGHDKSCATQRKVLAMADATKTLHEFGCWCAEVVLKAERKAGREPSKRSWDAIEAKRRWLNGDITDEELDAARAAAWAAVRDVAVDAARNIAGAAAGAATWNAARNTAAWGAAGAAAWNVAWNATAGDAARDAAKDAQNKELEKRLLELLAGRKA